MKKAYIPPKEIARETKNASQSTCGWFTQCGKLVQYRS